MTKTLFATAALLVLLPAHADISVTSPSFTYAESFDTLANAGTANAWVNDSTLTGWSLFGSTGAAVTTYRADAGTSNTGAIYSYGAAAATERALGAVASGSFSGVLALALTNNTGSMIDSFTLGYNGEQWRNGGNTAAQRLTFEYGFGTSYAATAFTPAGGSFDFVSPVVGATAGAVDGNGAGLVTGLGGTLPVGWAPGTTLWLRWVDLNDSGNDHGLAIDNLSLSVSAVPEPGSAALLLAGLTAAGLIVRRRRA